MNSIIIALLAVVVCVNAAVPPWIPAGSQDLYAPYTSVPGQDPDTSNTNIGVRFTVDISGNITGCSAYRHSCVRYEVCTLYLTATGAQLGNRANWPAAGNPTTGGEAPPCAEGWTFTAFNPPIPVTAGVEYTLGTLVTGGRYSVEDYGFSTARTVGHITVPVQGGVYRFGSLPWMPDEVWEDEEYFLSPMFKPNEIQSLYKPFTYVPAVANDNGAVSVGVRFTVDVPGKIVGCAVYSESGGCSGWGISCDLWNTAGTQLFDVMYPCNGGTPAWIYVNLTTPYAIPANVEYTMSALFQAGRYAGENNKFTSARTVGNIHVPENGGVYSYHFLPYYPQEVYLSSEYYVTPLFIAD